MSGQRWFKHAIGTAVFLLLAFMLASCGGGSEGNGVAGPQAPESAGSAANAGISGDETGAEAQDNGPNRGADDGGASQADDAAGGTGSETIYPLTVTDETGTDVTIDKAPERVVMLVPSDTEIVYAIGAGDLAAGADEYSTYPPEAADLPKVGDVNTNIEAVLALNPDLVLASASMNHAAIDSLRQLGVTVYAADPKTLEETIAHIEQIGVLLNRQDGARAVADRMREIVREVTERVADAEPVSVYLEFSPGWTVGSGTFLDELVSLAGGVNLSNDREGWFEVDPEAVIARNPQVIIYPDIEGVDFLGGILSRPGWDRIDAVRNNRVVAVANEPLVRVGPRLTDGLREIAAALHPERFP